MASSPPCNAVLGQLQSQAQLELLNAVDQLRLEGFQGELDLPQLIVCGDQSAGKSAVLEAISRLSFPSADVFCTRFATELILRKTATSSFNVWLAPAKSRLSEPNKNARQIAHIYDFKRPAQANSANDLPKVVQAANKHLEKLGKCAFYEDKLVVEISGPDVPSLTLVDLPGIIQSANVDQTSEDVLTSKRIVQSYMSNANSIILLILAADNNVSNQGVLGLAYEHDPQRLRTLGIITKPDRVSANSPSEGLWINRAKNRTEHLQLGWHVLKNRDFEHKDASADERDTLEAKFFQESNWSAVPVDARGISTLRARLSGILLKSVQTNLPGILKGIDHGIQENRDILKKLGQPKDGEAEQRLCLTEISSRLDQLIRNGTEGHFNGDFFNNADPKTIATRRLRARLQSVLEDFYTHINERGLFYVDGEDGVAECDFSVVPTVTSADETPLVVPNERMHEAVRKYTTENRTRELPIFGSSSVATHLFKVQSARWEVIAVHHLQECWLHIGTFFKEALHYVAPSHVANAITHHLIDENLGEILQVMKDKLSEIMRPYQREHIATLHREYLADRKKFYMKTHGGPVTDACHSLFSMGAYYQIALASFVENVANLVVEACLIDRLEQLFTPAVVARLDPVLMQQLTAEPDSVCNAREAALRKLEVLSEIRSTCRKHYTGSGSASRSSLPQTDRLSPAYPRPATQNRADASQLHEVPSTPVRNDNKNKMSTPALDILTPPKTPNPTTQHERKSEDILSRPPMLFGRPASETRLSDVIASRSAGEGAVETTPRARKAHFTSRSPGNKFDAITTGNLARMPGEWRTKSNGEEVCSTDEEL